jgi:tetratricopeptide (TPR) repeat protein
LYNSFIGYYFFIQDFKQAYIYADKLVKLFEAQPTMKKHKLEMYIKALNNLLVAQHKLYKYNEFVATQKQLVAIKRDKTLVLTENINLNLFKAIYFHEINRHFMSGEFKSGTRIVAALESEINKFISRLDKHSVLLFYYKISCLYFGSSNFKTALKWLNKILNEREIKLREDLYSFSRILSLICHFELEHNDLVESTIKSTYRYFIKKGDLTIYQTHILDFLKRILTDGNDRNLKKGLILLKDEMEKLEKNRFEKRAFIYFDIISWLESKIQKRSVQEIIKEKSVKRISSVEHELPS